MLMRPTGLRYDYIMGITWSYERFGFGINNGVGLEGLHGFCGFETCALVLDGM